MTSRIDTAPVAIWSLSDFGTDHFEPHVRPGVRAPGSALRSAEHFKVGIKPPGLSNRIR